MNSIASYELRITNYELRIFFVKFLLDPKFGIIFWLKKIQSLGLYMSVFIFDAWEINFFLKKILYREFTKKYFLKNKLKTKKNSEKLPA